MAWYDNNWQYRKKHTINAASGAGTNYQVKLMVHYGSGTDSGADVYLNSKCKTDFSDIRFTASDETTILDYWIESKVDSDNAVVWVEVGEDLSSVNRDIFIYYGNASTTSASNGSNTFLFFDDFTGNLSKWTVESSSGTYPKIENGYMRAGGGSTTSPYGWTSLGSSATFSSFNNNAVRWRAKVAASSIGEVAFRGNYAGNTGYKARFDSRSGQGNSLLKPPYSGWNFLAGAGADTLTPTADTLYTYEVTASGSTLTMYRNDTQVRQATDSSYASAGEIALQNHYGSYTDYAWVCVRKFVATEPAHGSWFSEETSVTTKSVSDTGSGVDSAPILRSLLVLSETGTVVEVWTLNRNQEVVTVTQGGSTFTFSISDSGSAAELLSSLARIPLHEAGSGNDLLSALIHAALSDTGHASERSRLLPGWPCRTPAMGQNYKVCSFAWREAMQRQAVSLFPSSPGWLCMIPAPQPTPWPCSSGSPSQTAALLPTR
jgi:hypothetical protein